jgi:hypothetical protein
VTKILGVDMLEYSMPQTADYMESIDWTKVTPGRKETYPEAVPPSDADFKVVKTVHEAVRKENDAAAIANGLPKSGVQPYNTYKQRWKQWRDIMAVFCTMNPTYDLALVEATARGCLKLCKSENAVLEVIEEEVKKHIAKIKRF